MNKDLIKLQTGCPATAVVVLNDEYKKLENTLVIKAEVENKIFISKNQKDELEAKAKNNKTVHLVISGIDKISVEKQNVFVGLVKDREFQGYNLPKNCIIVFTAESKHTLKKISNDLFHFCVVA